MKLKKVSFIVGLAVIVFLVIRFVVWAITFRNNFIASQKNSQQNVSDTTSSVSPPDIKNFDIGGLTASDGGVLGVSDTNNNASHIYTPPVPTPFPEFTLVPVPTYIPSSTATTYYTPQSNTTTHSCAGTPTAFNSEAIVSSSTTLINNPVDLTIELLDCNNNYGPVDDTLTVTLSNTDPSAQINGSASPATVKAQNGKVTVSINSQNAGTDTFIIHDVTRNFDVTDPHNHNPSITFGSNTTGNPNCTTGAGVPNSWFSDVYVSPSAINVGANSTFSVVIRDCFKNTVPANDLLSISLSSGDSSTKVNGNNLPYTVTAQNGQASFNVSSQNSGTSILIVQDTTSSFKITDTNNSNPSVTFNSPTAPNPTATPTATSTSPTSVPTSAPTSAPTQSPTSAPSSTPAQTPTPATAATTPTPTPAP